MSLIIVGFIIYIIVTFIITYLAYKKAVAGKQSDHQYSQVLVGGRSMHWIVTALAAHASDMSDWLFMAFPAAIYSGGMPNAWIAIGLVLGMLTTWHWLAPLLRIKTEHLNALTLPEYFEYHFNDTTGALRLASAAICIFFFTVYISAGLTGMGLLLETLFSIPFALGALVSTLFVVLYTLLGGYVSVAWVDCFQAIFLLCMIVLVPSLAFFHINGWASIYQASIKSKLSLSILPTSGIALINAILLAFAWGAGYWGMPHVLTKFMGIANVKDMKKSQYLGLSWQIIVLTAATFVGLIGLAYFPSKLVQKELIFVQMVRELFNPLVAGIVLSAIISATLSAVNAQVLIVSSSWTQDIYHKFLAHNSWVTNLRSSSLMIAYRTSVILVCFLAFVLTLYLRSTIQALVQYAWMGLGSSLGPLVIASLYQSSIKKTAALWAMVAGCLTASSWSFISTFIEQSTGIVIPALVPGFLVNLVLLYTLSRNSWYINK
ncbi:MAG TPA: sodium/proline symporter [Candidatus Babeliaceae bacterium]|nr:sodium/proline symporter [Candidatus Babeliaceae bacterium]